MALAFAPSSLLLGATTYVTTDIAALPLLWVLPLAIYLLSFIIAFGRWPVALQRVATAATLPLVLLVMFFMVSRYQPRNWVTALWHFAVLFVVALACHGELAISRPSPRRLTGFYLLISVGGVLGGLANALIAPFVFRSLVEYPLAMALACVLVAGARPRRVGTRARLLAVALPLGIILSALVLYSESLSLQVDTAFIIRVFNPGSHAITTWINPTERLLKKLLTYGAPLWRARCCGGARSPSARPWRACSSWRASWTRATARRSGGCAAFSACSASRATATRRATRSCATARRCTAARPMTRSGAASPVLLSSCGPDRAPVRRAPAPLPVTAHRGDRPWHGHAGRLRAARRRDHLLRDRQARARPRIRPRVLHLHDGRHRARCQPARGAGRCAGAARAGQEGAAGERYDLIVVDAFSSDAIPVHLLTREALQLYLECWRLRRARPAHLEPLSGARAGGGQSRRGRGARRSPDRGRRIRGSRRRHPVHMGGPGPDGRCAGGLAKDERWSAEGLEPDPRVGVWTDDFHNLLSVLKWR